MFSAILASISALPVDAAVRTNNSNRSYAEAYNQVNAMRYQQEYLNANAANATTASATAQLPVMVADEKLASAILNNTSETTIGHLENCAMVYPNGVFRWEIPESGIRRNQSNQCVAVVSLINANTNEVLATTTLAAGDAMKCNIDSFPESGMNAVALSKTELPADMAPTMEDVEKVMNEEQKQNAGFKIAAGAIIAGVAGNILAPKEAGDSKLFGTGKDQLIGTAAGVATGAGIMAASSYSGKVAGDTIKSTAVNAASGMIVGNMLAGASSEGGILVVKSCNIEKNIEAYKAGGTSYYPEITSGEHDCIVGNFREKGDPITVDDTSFYLINKNGSVKKCTATQEASGKTIHTNCSDEEKLADVKIAKKDGGDKAFKEIFGTKVKDTEIPDLERYVPVDGDLSKFVKSENATVEDNAYFKISDALTVKNPQHAYIVFADKIGTKFGGYKTSELEGLKNKHSFVYVKRNSNGSVGEQITIKPEKADFTPTSGSAEDGGLVDLSNQARTKGTLVGTAAGGAMGGFAGYQGAKSEITDRWTAAVREYEDSLSNFVCMTGTRYLSKYNDYVDIPTLKDPEQ